MAKRRNIQEAEYLLTKVRRIAREAYVCAAAPGDYHVIADEANGALVALNSRHADVAGIREQERRARKGAINGR